MPLTPLRDVGTRARPDAGPPPTPRGPLVGRAAELELVSDALEAARRGYGGALFVIGEPGVGRTRLAAEAVTVATGFHGTVVATGRASTVGPQIAYRPLVEALLSLARSRRLPEEAELGDYGGVLTRLLDGSRHVEVSALVVAEAVLRLLSVQARPGGALLVLDDLHEADPQTLTVVEYLLDHIAQLPVLLLCTARGGRGAAVELAARARQRDSATVLDLAPLGRADVRRLLAHAGQVEPAEVGEEAVGRTLAHSAGLPFVVRELLDQAAGSEGPEPAVPAAVAESVRRRVAELPPAGAAFLSGAALFGARFPLPVVLRAVGGGEEERAEDVRAAVAAYLIEPDRTGPGWYRFRHTLVRLTVRAGLGAGERVDLSARLAAALSDLRPALPVLLRTRAARLYEEAGQIPQALRLYCAAGELFLAEGPVERAVTPLLQAHRLARTQPDPALRAAVLERLLRAAVHTGRPGPLAALIAGGEVGGELPYETAPPAQRARIHARLSELALLTGGVDAAIRHLGIARRLLGDDPDDADSAVVDVVAAQVELRRLGPGRLRTATDLARRARAAAERADLPVEACRALLVLGRLTEGREGARSRAYLGDAHVLARRHGLGVSRASAEALLARTGTQRADHRARLEGARDEAHRLEAPVLWQEAERELACEEIRRGDFATAGERLRAVADEAQARGLAPTLALSRLTEAVRLAHQGRRAHMELALEDLERLAPDGTTAPGVRAMAYGLARAFCSLLEERPRRAEQELARALADETENPSPSDFGQHGLVLLLGVLGGRMGPRHLTEAADSGFGARRWNRQFALLAHAVLLGREARTEEADAAAEAALRAADPYPMARSLALRLVAEEAGANGWGTPVGWLREAEEYFHTAGLYTAAGACRAQLRAMGASIRQRRGGGERVPPTLRRLGVTVREFEVALLLVRRTGNKDIASALYISPRTVEKHVASLLRKTGHANRVAFAAALAVLVPPASSPTVTWLGDTPASSR